MHAMHIIINQLSMTMTIMIMAQQKTVTMTKDYSAIRYTIPVLLRKKWVKQKGSNNYINTYIHTLREHLIEIR